MLIRFLACTLAALIVAPTLAQCTPQFSPNYNFGTIAVTGYNVSEGPIQCAAVFDDGSGPALYAAGGSTVTVSDQGATYLSKFVNGRWHAVTGFNDQIHAMTVVNTDVGQVLYVAGDFTSIPGSQSAQGVASFNGVTWSRVGTGTALNTRALVAVPQGSGHILYAGGGINQQCVLRRFDGADWSNVPLPTFNTNPTQPSGIRALAWFDDGSGPKLYVGASVWWSLTQTNFGVAAFDGTTWTPMTGLLPGPAWPEVTSFAVLNESTGPALYVSGYFSTPPRPLARLENGSWNVLPAEPFPGQLSLGASTLLPINGPSGPALAVALGIDAHLATRIRIFQNDTWTDLPGVFGLSAIGNLNVRALTEFPSPGDVCAIGAFDNIDNQPVPHAARWTGASWVSLEPGLGTPSPLAGRVFPDPQGDPTAIYSGTRRFTSAGATPADLPGVPTSLVRLNSMLAMTTSGAMFQNDGSGWTLFPNTTSGVRFWITRDTGVETLVRSRTSGLSRFVANTWQALGPAFSSSTIDSVVTFDDQHGATLYIGGLLGSNTAATTPRLARLVDNQWQTITINGRVNDMTIFDLGSGPELIIATRPAFSGEPSGIFAWNGSTLRDIGAGLPASPTVSAVRPLDTGSGERLWCSAANALYVWNGAVWETSPDWSITNGPTSLAATRNLDGTHSIFAGGSIFLAGGARSTLIAELRFCAPSCTPDFNNDGDTGTDADIEAFFACLAGNCCPTCGTSDFNNDGDFGTDADIESFFRVLAGGPC